MRRLALALTCVWGLAAPAVGSTGATAPRPNFLVVMADDLGYETLGIHGGESYATPHLDALARSGMHFEHAHATPKCVPSRVTLLTGRYSFRTGAVESRDGWLRWRALPPDEITFGEILRDAGYATAIAGKWQLSLLKRDPSYPQQKGFDAYSLFAWHEGPRYFQPWIWQNRRLLTREVADRYGPDWYTGFLIDFIEENRERPFLAYYPMALPHRADEYDVPGPDGHKSYAEMVEYADRLVGRLLDVLQRLGLRERTLVIFTGDNGSPDWVTSRFRGRLVRGGKKSLTDAGTHVPLLASWKGTTPAGAVSRDLVDFSDLLPTLADLAGAELPKDRVIDGRSFAPQLRGRAGTPREWIYTEWECRGWIRDVRWKLYADGALYDLARDPEERHPLQPPLASEARAAQRRLRSALLGLTGGS